MPDYQHDLRFGTFITPVATPAQHAVDLAKVSDDSGLDLVTFQDHPYNPSLLDTWTLMAWVAAQTSRVLVSGNVVNVALRPPSVLARAAASLDLLSGGRAALGLGSGFFWDGVASMGGPRFTTGESITALEEAMDIIRGLWDTTTRAPLTAGGRFYAATGAQRGPTPAHDIPIWLGAYKPRMLGLIGRKADGWLPGLPIIKSGTYGGSLASGNAIIDEAATSAGRNPREITRLLNVTPNESADELVQLALEDGVSVFILLGADDPRVIERFARRVVPEVRERVAEARSTSEATS